MRVFKSFSKQRGEKEYLVSTLIYKTYSAQQDDSGEVKKKVVARYKTFEKGSQILR